MAGLTVGGARLLWFPTRLGCHPGAGPPVIRPDLSLGRSGRITVKAMRAFGLLQALYTQSRAYGWILDHHSTGVTIRSGNSLR